MKNNESAIEYYYVREPSFADATNVDFALFHYRRWLATYSSVYGDLYSMTLYSSTTDLDCRMAIKWHAFLSWCDHNSVSLNSKLEMVRSGHGR